MIYFIVIYFAWLFIDIIWVVSLMRAAARPMPPAQLLTLNPQLLR